MNLIDNIIKLTEFIFETNIEKGQKKPSLVLKFNKEITKKFFLGYNFKNILMCDNFNIQNIKGDNCVEIKLTKNADESAFNFNYKNLDNFNNLIKNNPRFIYELKYEQNDKYNTNNKNDEFISVLEDGEKAKENFINRKTNRRRTRFHKLHKIPFIQISSINRSQYLFRFNVHLR